MYNEVLETIFLNPTVFGGSLLLRTFASLMTIKKNLKTLYLIYEHKIMRGKSLVSGLAFIFPQATFEPLCSSRNQEHFQISYLFNVKGGNLLILIFNHRLCGNHGNCAVNKNRLLFLTTGTSCIQSFEDLALRVFVLKKKKLLRQKEH